MYHGTFSFQSFTVMHAIVNVLSASLWREDQHWVIKWECLKWKILVRQERQQLMMGRKSLFKSKRVIFSEIQAKPALQHIHNNFTTWEPSNAHAVERRGHWKDKQIMQNAQHRQQVESCMRSPNCSYKAPWQYHSCIWEGCGKQDPFKGRSHHRILHLNPFKLQGRPEPCKGAPVSEAISDPVSVIPIAFVHIIQYKLCWVENPSWYL